MDNDKYQMICEHCGNVMRKRHSHTVGDYSSGKVGQTYELMDVGICDKCGREVSADGKARFVTKD